VRGGGATTRPTPTPKKDSHIDHSHLHLQPDTYTDIHPIVVVARVLALTHMAKDYFEDVCRVVVIVVTLVQTSIGDAKNNTITIIIFAVAAATRSGILRGVNSTSWHRRAL